MTALLGCAACGDAHAPSPPRDLAPRAVSLASPIASCGGAGQLVDAPEEPSLAVDPGDSRHLVGAWQQDRNGRDGAAFGAAAAVSRDGGITWRETMLPALTTCAGGGPWALVSDTTASIGPDGYAYVGALGVGPSGQGSAVLVSASRDGGRTWAAPASVAAASRAEALLDKPSVLADPHRAGRVYAVWARYHAEAVADATFSRSDDHGATWSPPVALYAAGSEAQFSQLLAPADGSLVDVFVELGGAVPRNQARLAASRSTDHGVTWSTSVTVATFPLTTARDPERGTPIRAFGEDVSAAFGGGWCYAAWFEARAGGTSTAWVSGSRDGGQTWSPAAVLVQQPTEVFLPLVAVAGDGRVGATWYDLRNAAARPGVGTEVWAATSADRGRAWHARRLDGPFDLRTAPVAPGMGQFLGDYEGLVGLPSGFASLYVRTPDAGSPNRTEIAFARFG